LDDHEKQIPATENYTVKTTRDLKEKVGELQGKTGLNAKELFEAMVTTYELKNLEGTSAEQTEDMQVLRYHLNRSESIFISLVEKNQDLKRDFAMKMDEENVKLTSSLIDFQKQKQDLTNRLQNSEQEKSDIESRCFELAERNKELEGDHKRTTTTIDLLQKHNDELEARIKNAESLIEDNERLKEDLDIRTKEKDRLALSVETLTQKLVQTEKDSINQLEQIEKLHQLQIEKIQTDAEKTVLQVTQTLKDELGREKDQYFAKVEELRQENKTLAQELAITKVGAVKKPQEKKQI
jgi:chromosome segregation ATPase